MFIYSTKNNKKKQKFETTRYRKTCVLTEKYELKHLLSHFFYKIITMYVPFDLVRFSSSCHLHGHPGP